MSQLIEKLKYNTQKIRQYCSNVRKSFRCDEQEYATLTEAEKLPKEISDLVKGALTYEFHFKPIDVPLNYIKGVGMSIIATKEEGKSITRLQKAPKAVLDTVVFFGTSSVVFGSEYLKKEYGINLDPLAIPIVLTYFGSIIDLSFTLSEGSSLIGQFRNPIPTKDILNH